MRNDEGLELGEVELNGEGHVAVPREELPGGGGGDVRNGGGGGGCRSVLLLLLLRGSSSLCGAAISAAVGGEERDEALVRQRSDRAASVHNLRLKQVNANVKKGPLARLLQRVAAVEVHENGGDLDNVADDGAPKADGFGDGARLYGSHSL